MTPEPGEQNPAGGQFEAAPPQQERAPVIDAGADQISTAAGLTNPVQQAAALIHAAEIGAPFVQRCVP